MEPTPANGSITSMAVHDPANVRGAKDLLGQASFQSPRSTTSSRSRAGQAVFWRGQSRKTNCADNRLAPTIRLNLEVAGSNPVPATKLRR